MSHVCCQIYQQVQPSTSFFFIQSSTSQHVSAITILHYSFFQNIYIVLSCISQDICVFVDRPLHVFLLLTMWSQLDFCWWRHAVSLYMPTTVCRDIFARMCADCASEIAIWGVAVEQETFSWQIKRLEQAKAPAGELFCRMCDQDTCDKQYNYRINNEEWYQEPPLFYQCNGRLHLSD